MFIGGFTGTGKSVLLRYIYHQLRLHSVVQFVHIDLKQVERIDIPSDRQFATSTSNLFEADKVIDDLLDLPTNHKPVVLLWDVFEDYYFSHDKAGDKFRRLIEAANHKPNLFVIAATSSYRGKTVEPYKLRLLSSWALESYRQLTSNQMGVERLQHLISRTIETNNNHLYLPSAGTFIAFNADGNFIGFHKVPESISDLATGNKFLNDSQWNELVDSNTGSVGDRVNAWQFAWPLKGLYTELYYDFDIPLRDKLKSRAIKGSADWIAVQINDLNKLRGKMDSMKSRMDEQSHKFISKFYNQLISYSDEILKAYEKASTLRNGADTMVDLDTLSHMNHLALGYIGQLEAMSGE